jgi:hypothetical protein
MSKHTISPELRRRYRFFRQVGVGGYVGHEAETCLALARADMALAHSDVVVITEDEHEPWDGDCPAPEYLVWMRLVRPCLEHGVDCRHAETLNSLGMIGVNSMSDPYLRICAAELAMDSTL